MEKNACIIFAKPYEGRYFLGKNRDRNYTPSIKIVHEILKGVEVIYMRDMRTLWAEGMNEYGIGFVNSALLVARDEAEAKLYKKLKKQSKDGDRCLKVLTNKDLEDALETLLYYKGGLKGHNLISNGKELISAEHLRDGDPHVSRLKIDELAVRTNHGFFFADAGYTSGTDYLSSVIRRNTAKKRLESAKSPEDMMPALYKRRFEKNSPYNTTRDTENMRTGTQILLDLQGGVFNLYLIPERVEFLGVENKLPKGYTPKLTCKVYEYKGKKPVEMQVTSAKEIEKAAVLKIAREFSLNLKKLES